MVTSKEDVFRIMGAYYGNAYYRSAIRLQISEHDLQVTTRILDQVNALGYRFSNLHRLTDSEDVRFLPVVLEYLGQSESKDYQAELIGAFHCRSYSDYTPTLVSLYQQPAYKPLQFEISNALLNIRSRKYIPLYMDIVTSPEYGKKPDLVMEILCRFKYSDSLPVLLNLLHSYPENWQFLFLQYAHCFKDRSVIPDVQSFLNCDRPELCRMAQKALRRLEQDTGLPEI